MPDKYGLFLLNIILPPVSFDLILDGGVQLEAPARSRLQAGAVASVGFVPDRQNIFMEKTAGEFSRTLLEAI